jgi:hypothetical protein
MSRVRAWALLVGLATSLATGLTAGCSGPTFLDRPIVWRVDDRRSIEEPEENPYYATEYMARIYATDRGLRSLDIPNREPAHDVNALDEVPDSTWFENRIGRRVVTPAEAAAGPATEPGPIPPYEIVSGKSGGGNPGFVISDAKKRRYIVKFDTKENPEMQTGGNLVVNRIFWTIGYHVPADYVFDFSRDDLQIAKDATFKDALDRKEQLTWKQVDATLAAAPQRKDGSYRATASQFLDGVPKGGFSPSGLRGDDPNDVIPHEHRRSNRALRVFSAWVNHTDMKEDNTLDMYVTEGKHRYLKHYLVDFGEALGGHGAEKDRPEDGYEYFWDWDTQMPAIFAFGLWRRTWEDTEATKWPSIGWFSAKRFDPREWREAYPYWPFDEMDAADAYWGAKLVMRFDQKILRAIAAEARFSEPDATAYLAKVLHARRTAIGHAYLEAVTPFDALRVEGGKLCGYDLGVYHGLRKSGVLERLDGDGEVVESHRVGRRGRACVALPANDDYTIYRLRIRRGDDERPTMQVHLKGGHHPRVLGVIRVE